MNGRMVSKLKILSALKNVSRKLQFVEPRGTVEECHIAVVIWHCRTCDMKTNVICAWKGRLLTRVVDVLCQIMYVYLAS
jgi:hypothetical protein